MMTRKYRIWSFEHDGWWDPRSSGYTKDVAEAGIYESEEAHYLVFQANRYQPPNEKPNEALVPIDS